MSRQDPQGTRTSKAVRDAARGFGIALSAADLERLVVLDVDFDHLGRLAGHDAFKQIDEVWHSAAEMTYNPLKLDKAVRQNLNATYELFQLVAAHTSCKRFYYVSTAYTAGLAKHQAMEELHLDPALINVYQTSKWSAEMSLAQAQQRTKLPVTIFRPSIVVGHQATGWHGKSNFGLYSFLGGLQFAKAFGAQKIKLDIGANAKPNLVPIDVVCSYALGLAQREAAGDDFEVFHAVASNAFTNRALASVVSLSMDLQVTLGAADCPIGLVIDKKLKKNVQFAKTTWDFDTTRLQAVLGDKFRPFHMSEVILNRMIREFMRGHPNPFAPRNAREQLAMVAMRCKVLGHRLLSA